MAGFGRRGLMKGLGLGGLNRERDNGCIDKYGPGSVENRRPRCFRASGAAKGKAPRGCPLFALCNYARMADRCTLRQGSGGHRYARRRKAGERRYTLTTTAVRVLQRGRPSRGTARFNL